MDSDFSGIPTSVLDSLRVRLAQLVHSLNVLQQDVSGANLQHWPALLKQFKITLLQLGSVTGVVADHADVLQKLVAVPTPAFPTKTSALLLTTLLRKKNLPDVEAWIESGNSSFSTESSSSQAADDEFCEFAWDLAEEITQINVTPLNLQQPQQDTSWSLETAISYTLGNRRPTN